MFGDPAFNPMNWEVVELSSLLREKASNGFFAKNDEYRTGGNAKVMWLGDIINRRYSNIEGLKEVDTTDVQLNKYRVKYGDLLFCRSSLNKDGIGKASAVPKDAGKNIMFECHIIRTPLDLSKCIPEFIQVQSTMDYFRNQIMSNSKTATMTTIGQDGIITTKVILPKLDLQKQFVEFIYQIDKLKFEIQNSLKELKLFD
ncbi:TPA: restriction endonuclease subunit S [Clostridium botulinum]|nr:restriction endonuclease subunit S [Clostridium botulinum]